MARNAQAPGAPVARTAEIRIRRYQPEQAPKPSWRTSQAAIEPNERLLDALNRITPGSDETF